MGGVIYKLKDGTFGELYTKHESLYDLIVITEGTDATCDKMIKTKKANITKFHKPESRFKLGELVKHNGTVDRIARCRINSTGEYFCYSLTVNKTWIRESELEKA